MNKQKLNVVSCSLTAHLGEQPNQFRKRLINEINTWDQAIDIVVFPEYCWGDFDFRKINEIIENVIETTNLKSTVIFGTAPFSIDGDKITNNAIIRDQIGKYQFISKERVLKEEQNRTKVVSRQNSGTILIDNIKIGVVICADAWYAPLLAKLTLKQHADLIVIPAFTTVPKNLSSYARNQWYSLGITRSREFTVPIVIADHSEGTEAYDVGNASSIIDPSLKSSQMKEQLDFLITSKNNSIVANLDLQKIRNYRNYRLENGLLKMW